MQGQRIAEGEARVLAKFSGIFLYFGHLPIQFLNRECMRLSGAKPNTYHPRPYHGVSVSLL